MGSESGECYFVLKEFANYSFNAGAVVCRYPVVIFGDYFHVTKHDINVLEVILVVLVDLFILSMEVVE